MLGADAPGENSDAKGSRWICRPRGGLWHFAGQRPADHQDRRHPALFRAVCRSRSPGRQRHQALHATARRHGRRQEDRGHPQGYRRHRARRRQAARPGIGGARQGRSPRRLLAHAQCNGGGGRVGAGQEVHGGDERGGVGGHDQVALHGARVLHAAAVERAARHLGLQERGAESLFDGGGFCRRPRRRSRLPRRVQGGRWRDHRLGAISRRQSRLLGLRAARQGHEPGSDLHLRARRIAVAGDRQGVGGSRHRPAQDQGHGATGAHRRAGPEEHGRHRDRHHHVGALRLQPRLRAQQGIRDRLQRRLQTQSGFLRGRRLRRHAPDLRDLEESQRQYRRRCAHRSSQGHGLGEPARPDLDRSGDPRYRPDRLYAAGGERSAIS